MGLWYIHGMTLITLVYVSSAVRLMTATELIELLRGSRERNQQKQITGLLLYRDGNFMQALEGEETAVDGLHEHIHRDPRHRGLITLIRQPISERVFGEWSMGFRNLDDLNEQQRVDVSTFLTEPFTSDQWRSSPHKALTLLRRFRDDQR